MFKSVVILKRSPWFIYVRGDEDAKKVIQPIYEYVVGVVSSDTPLVVNKIEMKPTLFHENQKVLESADDKKLNVLCNEVSVDIDKEIDTGIEEIESINS